MTPQPRNHSSGHDAHRSPLSRLIGGGSGRSVGSGPSLAQSLVKAGFYPDLLAHALDEELEGREVRAHLVHLDTHFDFDEIHRHITVLAVCDDVVVAAHLDDHPLDEQGQHMMAQVSTELVALKAISTVVISTGHVDPARFRPGAPVSEMTLGVQWAGGQRIDLQPAGCADPQCDADHGYTGTSTREDLVVRVAAEADGQQAVDDAVAFARALRRAHVAATA
ncbi:MAG: DUF5998 family protein [Micrococcus sp.]|nr:DUF5998 family protein [Micrococcus sp.]